MSRPSPAVLAALLLALAIVLGEPAASGSAAANLFPTPGGAPGSTTGDAGKPFAGLAEAPSAAAFTGSAVTSIPIVLPPGRAGATPKLDLRYASSDGAGPYGVGWSLPIARIARSTRRGVPRYDASDAFVLETASGSVELVAVAGTKRYVAEIESAFLRIGFDEARNVWKVVDKSGTVMHFGSGVQHRMGPDVREAGGTYAWLLAQSVDAAGNNIDYAYLPGEDGEATPGLPSRIDYGANLEADVAHPFSVRFAWSTLSYPSVSVVSYAAGFALRRDRLLTEIEALVEGEVVRRYSLSHDQDAASGAARLVGVSLDAFAEDPNDDVALPSTVFSYTDSVVTDWPVGPTVQRMLIGEDLGDLGPIREIEPRVHIDTFDIDGDGLVDIVDATGSEPVVRKGTGFGFGPPAPWAWPSAGPRDIRHVDDEGNLDNNVFDIDGDGLPDLVSGRTSSGNPDTWTVWRNTGNGFDAQHTPWPAPHEGIREASADASRTWYDVADLDGDGRPDFVNAFPYHDGHRYWHVRWNTGAGFEPVDTLFRAHRPYINRSRTSNSRRQLLYGLFDMNGDGLPDFVVAPASRPPQDHWDVYLNDGSGFADEPLEWRVEGDAGYALPDYLNETDGERGESQTFVDVVDMTGDGLPDLIRHARADDPVSPPACGQTPVCTGSASPPVCCKSLLLFVNTGSSFSAPVSWAAWHGSELRSTADPIVATERQFDLFDFDGDGLVDLVDVMDGRWHLFRHPASVFASWSSAPVAKRGRPDLMTSMLNGVGGETHIAYVPAALMAESRIPFPHWVVSEVSVRDGVTNTQAGRVEHLYRGGLWDGGRRELRGFRDVWQTDSTGVTVVTEFHQDVRLSGMVRQTSVLGVPPCRTHNPMNPADPCSPLHAHLRVDTNAWSASGPVLLELRTSTPYAANAPVPELAKQTAYLYDAFGNVVRETVSSPSAATVTTETAYVHVVADEPGGMPGRYLVDKPTRTLTREETGSGATLAESTFAYDAAFPRRGLLTSTSACIEWNAGNCERWKTLRYRHDDAGNVVRVSGPLGTTTTQYDPHLLYAQSVRNSARHLTFSVRELRSGREIFRRGANGAEVETAYDGLGRPVRSWSEGFSRTVPEVASTYVDGTLDGAPGRVKTRQHGAAPVTIFYDGLGRELGLKTRVETSQGEKTVVSALKGYDSAGRVTAQSVTFEALSSSIDVLAEKISDAPGMTQYVYDSRGHLTETVLPDGSRTLHDASRPGVRLTVHANLAGGEHPGKAEIELLDGLERVWRKDVCSASPSATDPTRCPAGGLLERNEYEYDGLDRPVRTIGGAHTANPTVTETRYDGLGNRIEFSSADHGRWAYTYDDAGLLATAVDPRGKVMSSRYDKLGRLSKQQGEDFKARYVYHRRGPGAGLVRAIKSRSGETRTSKTFVYDTRGRIVEEEIRLRVSDSRLRATTRYEYDSAGRRTSVTYPAADGGVRRLVTTYTPHGRPASLTAYDGDKATEIVREVSYDLLGNVELVRLANGLADVFGHGDGASLGRLECIRTTRAASVASSCLPSSADERRIYVDARDTAGNILSLRDALHGFGSPLRDTVAYTYDSLGRVSRAERDTGAVERFTYDAHGNLLSSTGVPFAYSTSSPHRPTLGLDRVIAHDEAGNRTRKGAWTYLYDGMGRLTEVREGGSLRELAYYDEGSTRVARYDATTGSLRHYVGGLFEVEGSQITRHYWLGDRIVASDVIDAPSRRRVYGAATIDAGTGAAGARPRPKATAALAGALTSTTDGFERSGPADADAVAGAAGALTVMLLLAAVVALGPTRSGLAIVTAVAFLVATTPLPSAAAFSRGAGRSTRATSTSTSTSTLERDVAAAAATLVFYHPDHLGSPYLVSNAAGAILEHHRYDAYGRTRAVFDDAGNPLDGAATDVSYTGKTADTASGLIYFGSRYYDPELGLFLTPDPQAQFASPYLYGGGNPVNGVDPDGELFGILAAVLGPILISAAVQAFISGVTAAMQGGDFAQGFTTGFVLGLTGSAVGTALGGLNIAYQYAAGGAKFIEAAEALDAFARVAARSSFTSTVTHATVSVADTAGLSSDWVTALSIVTPLLSSYAYDSYIIKDSGAASSAGGSQREMAKEGFQPANTLTGHENVTTEAANQGTGYERHAAVLTEYNKAMDGPAPTGQPLTDAWQKLKALATNHDHFGRLPSSLDGIYGDVSEAVAVVGNEAARNADSLKDFFEAVGQASHLVQDHLTLGHMVPGTSLFVGPLGAPIRFVIHQTFGGEIAFRNAQVRATRALLLRFPPIV